MNTRENERTFSTQDINRQRDAVSEGVERATTAASETYNQAKNFVDEKVQSAKKTVDSAASEASSTLAKAVDKTMHSMSDGLEAGKKYIAEHHLDKIVDDCSGVIKKYPVQSLFAGIGLGIIVGNVLSRK